MKILLFRLPAFRPASAFRSFAFRSLALLSAFFCLAHAVQAQKAAKVSVATLLTSIPVPQKSDACYAACTKNTDASNGAVSIKDNGPAFSSLQDELMKLLNNGVALPTQSRTAPTPEQIEQMKQQAMAQAQQRMAQAQAMQQSGQPPAPGTVTAARPSDDPVLMRQIGQAQSTAAQANALVRELNDKMAKLDRSGVENVKSGPNCPEVQQGGYAGPTCACLKAKAVKYYNERTDQEDLIVHNIASLLQDYMVKLKPLLTSIDDVIVKADYGDAVVNPAFKQQVSLIQRQALGSVVSMLSMCDATWKDAAVIYCGSVNANSGASVGCHGK